VVLADLRERFPQLEQLQSMAERWLSSQRVLLAVDETALVLLWQQGESLTLRHVPLPQGLCRAGLPMQREALGELLADLLLDIGIQGGQLEMLLPMQSCQWRLLCWPDGEPDEDQVKALRQLSPELNWPFALADSYLTVKSLQLCSSLNSPTAMSLAVRTDRLMVNAWVDVIEAADLPLLGLEWMLTAAWRTVREATKNFEGDLVWLVKHDGRWRLLLLRGGLPELDHALSTSFLGGDSPDELLNEVDEVLQAWHQHSGSALPLAWWITAAAVDQQKLRLALNSQGQAECLSQEQIWLPGDGSTVLEGPETDFWKGDFAALACLALAGAWEQL